MDDDTRVCRRCGVEQAMERFERTSPTARLHICKTCRAKSKAPFRGRPKPRPCQNCGGVFQPKAYENVHYCSKRCSRLRQARQAAERKWEGRGCPIPWRRCLQCGEEFYKRRPAKLCGEACRQRYASVRNGHSPRGSLLTKTCAVCHAPFTYISTTCPVTTCSAECQQVQRQATSALARFRRDTRLATQPAEAIRPPDIYNRDGWRCQICGNSVNKRARFPHPEAPTLDHIVPVSKGGSHVPANVRLAHFICNTRRGNRGWL